MSGMYNRSMWWLFLLLFGLTIGSIQFLGWWTRQASAQSQSSHTPIPKHIQACEPKHWRSMVMHP
jgi:hypothetical protein